MGTDEYDEIAARLRTTADVVNSFKSEAVQLRVVEALLGSLDAPGPRRSDTAGAQETGPTERAVGGGASRKPRRRPSMVSPGDTTSSAQARKRSSVKRQFKMVSELNPTPPRARPLNEFVTDKQPTSNKEKCLVAVYWLTHEAKVGTVTADHVFTVFRLQNWPLPTNFGNTISQTGTQGWVNVADRDDMTPTNIGINHVEHQMPTRRSQN